MNEEIKVGDLIRGRIESLAFGGEGILRHQGFVIFVPFVAPDEEIVCQIKELKKNFAKAELKQILKKSLYPNNLKNWDLDLTKAPGFDPSKTTQYYNTGSFSIVKSRELSLKSKTNFSNCLGIHRIKPHCPYFGTCGGCQLQHLDEESQMTYKVDAVKDALERIGRLSFPAPEAYPAKKQWAYRRHITLHLQPYDGSFQAGYIQKDKSSLLQVQTCPIFNDFEDSILECVQKIVRAIPNPQQVKADLHVLKCFESQYILSFRFHENFNIPDQWLKKTLAEWPMIAGIGFYTPSFQKTAGRTLYEQEIEGLVMRFSSETFIQNHPEQSARINRHICQIAQKDTKTIFDLYCGIGTTSLLLQRLGHSVIGIESNHAAIQFAKENAILNGLVNATFIQGNVEHYLLREGKKKKPDLVIVNPPRVGLSTEVLYSLIEILPKEMIYISCMPSTLARDLKFLSKNYKIQRIAIYDMFPQTAHVETLVHLSCIFGNTNVYGFFGKRITQT